MQDRTIFFEAINDVRPGDGWERGWTTRRIRTPDGGSIAAKFTAHYINGNRAPYISVTGTTWDAQGREDSGGCIHDEILAAFPTMARLVALHLVDVDGQPSHHVANAQYHAAHAAGLSKWENTGRGNAREHFARHVVAGILPTDENAIAALFEPIEVNPPAGVTFEHFGDSPAGLNARRAILDERVRAFCDARADALRAHVVDTLALYSIDLTGLNYPGAPVDAPPPNFNLGLDE